MSSGHRDASVDEQCYMLHLAARSRYAWHCMSSEEVEVIEMAGEYGFVLYVCGG